MKRIISLMILGILFLNVAKAQTIVVFDPATVDAGTLSEGMTVVDIDGTQYLKVELKGWDSFTELVDAVEIPAGLAEFSCMAKYETGTSGFTVDQVNTFIKFSDADENELFALAGSSSEEFTEYATVFGGDAEMVILQVAGQETVGWSAVEGDVLYLGKMTVTMSYQLENVLQGEPTDDDVSAAIQAEWNEEAIHIVFDVTDDTKTDQANPAWDAEGVEIYFDMDDSNEDAYDTDDNAMQLSYKWGQDNSSLPGEWIITNNETGYMLDVTIPFSSLCSEFVPEVGAIIGFDVMVADNDDGTARESKIALLAKEDNVWMSPANMDNLVFLENGLVQPITKHAIHNDVTNVLQGAPTVEDFAATFIAFWGEEFINVVVDVNDDIKTDTANPEWEAESVEIYFDMDNSKGSSYDTDDNAMQLTYKWGQDNSSLPGEWIITNSETGYTLDVTIPYTSLGSDFVPAVGTIIGFDVMVADNDDGGARESKIAYLATEDNVWNNPANMGNLIFLEDGYTAGIPTAEVTINVDVNALIAAELFVVGTDFVDIAGSLNNWASPAAASTTDTDADGIYTAVVKVPVGDIEYKTRINANWDFSEFPAGGANRTYTVVEGENIINITFNDGDITPWGAVVTNPTTNPTTNAINSIDASSFNVYPSPANNSLTITNTSDIQKIAIYNVVGKQMFASLTVADQQVINTSSFDTGIYIVKLTDSNNNVATIKFAKK